MTELKFIPVITLEQIRITADLANEIMMEHYCSYIPVEHIKFYLDTFQTPEAISSQIKDTYEYYHIQSGDELVGYIGLSFETDKVILSKFYVRKNQRGKGIGKEALALIEERCRSKNQNQIELYVNALNPKGIALYEREGFEKIEFIPHTYDNGHTEEEWLMRKILSE